MDEVTVEKLVGTSSPALSCLREEALPILTSPLEQEPAGDRAGGSTDEITRSTDSSGGQSADETTGGQPTVEGKKKLINGERDQEKSA